MKYKIKDIIIGERSRKNFYNIDKLAASIKRIGQIEPIVITKNGELFAGERRLRACMRLGHEDIDVTYKEDATGTQKLEIELEENRNREDMEWPEYADLYYKIHQLKLSKASDRNWHLQDTAEALDISLGSLSEYLTLYQHKEIPEVKACKTYKAAVAACKRLRQKKLMQKIGEKKIKEIQEKRLAEKLERKDEKDDVILEEIEDKDSQQVNNLPEPYIDFDLQEGDCLELITYLENESINLILTDPLWGVNIESGGKFDVTKIHFDDSPEALLGIIPIIVHEMYRVLTPDAHMYIFISIDFFFIWKAHLEKAGFYVRSQPLIWVKEKGGYTDTFNKHMGQYECILFASKGARPFIRATTDVYSYSRPPTSERLVPTQKPLDLLEELIDLSSSPGETVLDLFGGSCSTVRAAYRKKRIGIAFEKDPAILQIGKFLMYQTVRDTKE